MRISIKNDEKSISEMRDLMNKIDVWVEEDSIRAKNAAAYLKLSLNEGAIYGRKNGYAAAIKDVYNDPEKYGFKKIEQICPECHGEGTVPGKIGGSEGIPEADVEFVCNECGGSGKINKQ